MSLLSWLTATQQSVRQVEAAAKVTAVLGNMAADLDSGVSSLVLAYHRANIKGVSDISRNTMLKESTTFRFHLLVPSPCKKRLLELCLESMK